MLVVSNGTFKSGSTWLTSLAGNLLPFEYLPKKYTDSIWDDRSIKPRLLKRFLKEVDFHSHHYISKNHLGDPRERELLTGTPGVRILHIKRDMRDVIVSAFYHFRREGYFRQFRDYYWHRGRIVADHVRRYNQVWEAPCPSLFRTTYETLKNDTKNEAARLAAFLDHPFDDAIWHALQEKTSLASLARKRGEADKPPEERFFRKGIVGDWVEHFDEEMLEDLHRIETHGLAPSEWLRQKIKNALATTRLKIHPPAPSQ